MTPQTRVRRPYSIEFSGGRREAEELAQPIAEAVRATLASADDVLLGEPVARFEAEIAGICGRRFAVCVGSGTDALFFALRALDLGPDDEVLVPDLSFIATATAVLRSGAQPVFVDIDETGGVDLEHAEARVTPRTRALVYAQMAGGMGDPRRIEAFAAAHRLQLIEDGAQSFGARFDGFPCGAMGAISAMSFDPMKVVSAVTTAGALLTNDPALAGRARRLRYHGREDGQYVELGYNSQLSSLSAAVLSVKLARHAAWTERRRRVAQVYREILQPLGVGLPQYGERVEHVWHKFSIQVAGRDAIAGRMAKKGIPTKVHYPRPFHREPLFKGSGNDEDFPRASRRARETLSLPLHAHLSDAEVDFIAKSVVECLG